MFNLDNPFVGLLNFFADLLGGNFGFSIIAITIIIRLLLLPLFMKQEKQLKETQEKFTALKPEMSEIQEKISQAKTDEERLSYQLELFNLRKKHNISLQSMGFLPSLLQAPVLMGFYAALTTSDILQNHSFLWFALSSHDVLISVIVGLLYLLLFKINRKLAPQNPEQPKQLAFVGYIFPAFMFIFALNMPAGIGLYWVTGALFMILYKLLLLIKKRSK